MLTPLKEMGPLLLSSVEPTFRYELKPRLCTHSMAKEGLRSKAPWLSPLHFFLPCIHHLHSAVSCFPAWCLQEAASAVVPTPWDCPFCFHNCLPLSLIFGPFYIFSFHDGLHSVEWINMLGTEMRNSHFCLSILEQQRRECYRAVLSGCSPEPPRQELSGSIHRSPRLPVIQKLLWEVFMKYAVMIVIIKWNWFA